MQELTKPKIDSRAANETYEHFRILPDETFLCSNVYYQEDKGDRKTGWYAELYHRYEYILNDPNVYLSSGRIGRSKLFKRERDAKRQAVEMVNEYDASKLSTQYYYVHKQKEVEEW